MSDAEDIRLCPVCNNKVKLNEMLYTRDCHGIIMRLVCYKCHSMIMKKGYDGEYYGNYDDYYDDLSDLADLARG